MTLEVSHAGRLGADALSALSWGALARDLDHDGELVTAVSTESFEWFGRFQRTNSTRRRRSGGPALLVGTNSVYLGLALARPDALADADVRRLSNRYVRPLLRGLGALGAISHYFDRDWVASGKERRPLAWIGFGHHAATGRSLVEVIVAIDEPFGAPETHPSFGGKRGLTLAELRSPCDAEAIAARLREAYRAAYDGIEGDVPERAFAIRPEPGDDTPWTVTTDGAMGAVGARFDDHGRLDVGGALFVSEDALSRFERTADEGAFDPPAILVGLSRTG